MRGGCRGRGLDFFCQRLGRIDAIFPAHVAVRHDANRVRTECADKNSARLQPRDKFRSALPRRQPEDHDIGLDRREIDDHALSTRQRFGQQPGVGVVFGETFRSVFERDQSRRGQHTRLPHSAA